MADLSLHLGARRANPTPMQSFDPADWIARATNAGATMFVREGQLWIGAFQLAGSSRMIDGLQAELDDDARAAVCECIASRSLRCVEG